MGLITLAPDWLNLCHCTWVEVQNDARCILQISKRLICSYQVPKLLWVTLFIHAPESWRDNLVIYILNINTKGEAHHFACFADVLYICVYCLWYTFLLLHSVSVPFLILFWSSPSVRNHNLLHLLTDLCHMQWSHLKLFKLNIWLL